MFGFGRKAPHSEAADLSSKRSIQIRDQNEQRILVDFFYHAGEFWTASIPTSVANVYGQSFNFSMPRKRRRGKKGIQLVLDKHGYPKPTFSFINHLQTRFRLSPDRPLKLFPLMAANTNYESRNFEDTQPAHCIDDFVYSVEATGLPGSSFDFKNGLAGNLLCMHRFLSTQEMVFERVVVQSYYVWESPPLSLSDANKSKVLAKSLARSDEAGLEEVYYLYRCCRTNNCTSNPFQIVDECVRYTWLQRLGAFAYRFPLNPRLYLWMRGLDSDPSFRKLVRADFEQYISDPETQQRKRDVIRKAIEQRRAFRSGDGV